MDPIQQSHESACTFIEVVDVFFDLLLGAGM
jgi:hypothetical protein